MKDRDEIDLALKYWEDLLRKRGLTERADNVKTIMEEGFMTAEDFKTWVDEMGLK